MQLGCNHRVQCLSGLHERVLQSLLSGGWGVVGQIDAPVYAMPCSIADNVPRRGGRLKICRLHRPRYWTSTHPVCN